MMKMRNGYSVIGSGGKESQASHIVVRNVVAILINLTVKARIIIALLGRLLVDGRMSPRRPTVMFLWMARNFRRIPFVEGGALAKNGRLTERISRLALLVRG